MGKLIADRLSVRLLILQCVFSVGGVWCHASEMQFVMLQECTLRMQLKVWLVHKHPSHLGMFTKFVYALRKLIFLSAVAALAVSLLRQQNGDVSEKERARSLARKRKRRQRA